MGIYGNLFNKAMSGALAKRSAMQPSMAPQGMPQQPPGMPTGIPQGGMSFEGGLGGYRPGMPNKMGGLGQGIQQQGMSPGMPQLPPQIMAMLAQRFGGQNQMGRQPGLFAGNPFQQTQGASMGQTRKSSDPYGGFAGY